MYNGWTPNTQAQLDQHTKLAKEAQRASDAYYEWLEFVVDRKESGFYDHNPNMVDLDQESIEDNYKRMLAAFQALTDYVTPQNEQATTPRWTTAKPFGSSTFQHINRYDTFVATVYGKDQNSVAGRAEFIVKACNAYEEMLAACKPSKANKE